MAFSDLCHIGKTYKTVENETDQSERIMEENSIVRDLITKILDETGPAEASSSIQSPEKAVSGLQSNYPKNDTLNTSYIPPSYNSYQSNLYSFPQNDQNGFNNFNIQNGFGNTNGFVNYPDNDVSVLLGIEPVTDTSTDTVTPEQLNLLRLAAQEIGGAQFTTPNKFDDKYYNFFEPNQRNSLPETSMFSVTNFNRPNSLNLDMNYNSNYDYTAQRYANNFKDQNQDPTELLSYLSQLNLSRDRVRDEILVNNIDFKMPMDLNGHYPSELSKTNNDEQNKMFYNRNYQQLTGNKNFVENNYYDVVSQINDRSPISQNYDFANQNQPPVSNSGGAYKPNGYQNEFVPRRDMNQMVTSRDNYQPNGGMGEQRTNFDNVCRDNMQQAALIRQNQELARQMNLLMRNRPPPSQLNVDVSFLHENTPYNIGPSPTVPPPVLPSPMLDLPLLAPFYAMRNIRGASTSSSILHGRLDACYEQWRQLERERKRTEARLALAYPGRAVSSSNSIPVPRLPPCPTRVDRLTVDMLREHTKVLTLMGKMETLRASVCVAQNKRPNKPEDAKITVLKRGQENVPNEKDSGLDPNTFDPSTWREDLKNLSEIAPHSEVESAMLSWRSAVGGVQAARRRELAPHHQHPHAARYPRNDPILQLADAVKQLSISARRARCAMWCDLTLTVALAPDHHHHHQPTATATATTITTAASSSVSDPSPTTTLVDICPNENAQQNSQPATPTKQPPQDKVNQTSTSKQNTVENKEEKPAANETKPDTKTDATSKTTNKQTDKQDKSRRNQYRKLNQGRSDFYQKNQRYDARFMHNRPPYHYLATGPIN